MTECRCGRPTRDEAFACDDCCDRLARALGEIPWLDAELETTISGQRGVDYRRRGGTPSSEARLPVNLAAAEAARDLRAVLVPWVKFCAEEGVRHQSPHEGFPADDVAAMSRWLMWRVDGLALLDIGLEAVDEITAVVARGKRLVDRPADRWYAGPCEACDAAIYVTAQAVTAKCMNVTGVDGNDDPVKCGFIIDVAARRATLLLEAEDRLATAANLARAVSWLGAAPLTADRVRKWAERKRIIAHGHDGKSPLYRVGDAIDLLAREAKSA